MYSYMYIGTHTLSIPKSVPTSYPCLLFLVLVYANAATPHTYGGHFLPARTRIIILTLIKRGPGRNAFWMVVKEVQPLYSNFVQTICSKSDPTHTYLTHTDAL